MRTHEQSRRLLLPEAERVCQSPHNWYAHTSFCFIFFIYLYIILLVYLRITDDQIDFKIVIRAMGVLGIGEKDQDALWSVLAAILLLGTLLPYWSSSHLPSSTIALSHSSLLFILFFLLCFTGNVKFAEKEDPTSRQPTVSIADAKSEWDFLVLFLFTFFTNSLLIFFFIILQWLVMSLKYWKWTHTHSPAPSLPAPLPVVPRNAWVLSLSPSTPLRYFLPPFSFYSFALLCSLFSSLVSHLYRQTTRVMLWPSHCTNECSNGWSRRLTSTSRQSTSLPICSSSVFSTSTVSKFSRRIHSSSWTSSILLNLNLLPL